MKLRRTLCAGLFACGTLGIILLDPQFTSGQPGGFGKGPGGGPGGGGREFKFGGGSPMGGGQPGGGQSGGGKNNFTDPDFVFRWYSRGGDTIDMARMDENMKNQVRRGFEKAGMPVPPDNAVITKAQFTENFTRALAAKGITPGGPLPQPGFGGGGPPGGGSMTFRMGDGNGERRSMSFGPPPGGGGPPGNGWNGGGNNGWNGGNNNGWNGGGNTNWGNREGGGNGSLDREKMAGPTSFRMTDQDIERRFNDQDANRDGKLSEDEIPEGSRLKAGFKESDTNRDGYIDAQEYKAYIASRFGEGSDPNAGSYGSYAGNGNYGRDPRDPRQQEQPVVAIRYGKLPTGLPSWWDSLDVDKDGQIGLYEWRQDGREIKDFQEKDLDGDGYLAPQEWQRYNVLSAEKAKAIAAEEAIGGSGTPKTGRPTGYGSFPAPGTGGAMPKGNWPAYGGGKDKGSSDKGSDRDRGQGDNSKNNPFRSGDKKR